MIIKVNVIIMIKLMNFPRDAILKITQNRDYKSTL